MLQTTFARVRDEDVPRLRSWLAALSSRRDELRDSYRQQGTRHELFFLVPTRHFSILILVSEVDDADRAASSVLRSQLPIDVEFKALFQGISPEEAEVELLYDSSDYVSIAAA
jgi:hypothetical protein